MDINELLNGFLKVVVVEPGKFPYAKTIENDLDALKATIGGGYIETFPMWVTFGPQFIGLVGVCDEDGKSKGLPPNMRLAGGDMVVGTFFVVRSTPPDFKSLTDLEAQRVNEALTIR